MAEARVAADSGDEFQESDGFSDLISRAAGNIGRMLQQPPQQKARNKRGPKLQNLKTLFYLLPPGGDIPKTSQGLKDDTTTRHIRDGYGKAFK